MDPSKVRRDLVIVLINLMIEAIQMGRTDLASKVLNTVRLFRPQLKTEYFQFGVWILIRRGDYMDAIRELNGQDPSMPQWRAMMCLCLAATGDPTWNMHADLVLEGEDETSKLLIRGLRGDDPAADGEQPLAHAVMPVDLGHSLGRM